MEAIDILYNKIFKNLPFSITGRLNLEEDLYRFYDSISESVLFEHSSNFKFFLGSVLRLVDEKKWELKSYDEIYFKSNVHIDKNYFLSFYYYALSQLKGTENIEDFNASRVLADVFAKKLNLKISLTDDELPTCNYDVRISLLEVFIPKSVYTDLANKESYRIKEVLFETLNGADRIFKRKPKTKFPRHFSFHTIEDKSKYQNLFEKLINTEKKNIVVEKLKEVFKSRYSFLFTTAGDNNASSKYTPDDLAVTCVGLTLFCLYYDSVFEYLTSVAKIDESIDSNIMRNLGGIAIGYDSKNQINNEQRALFCLLSDWATAVIAGQLLHDREKLREKPLGKALYELKDTLDHKCPFQTCNHHYKHVTNLIKYAEDNTLQVDDVWIGIRNDILLAFDSHVKQVKELYSIWSNIKISVEEKDATKTGELFDELESKLEGKIIIRSDPQTEIYLNNPSNWNVELFFIKHHIDSILEGIYKNAKRWGARAEDKELNVNHHYKEEKLSVLFHVGKEPVNNFDAIKAAASTSSEQFEKLGGMITLLNKLYHADLKFVNKKCSEVSSLHYTNGVEKPTENKNDSDNSYTSLDNGLHYQIIFK